jgi:hypothetical protein
MLIATVTIARIASSPPATAICDPRHCRAVR